MRDQHPKQDRNDKRTMLKGCPRLWAVCWHDGGPVLGTRVFDVYADALSLAEAARKDGHMIHAWEM